MTTIQDEEKSGPGASYEPIDQKIEVTSSQTGSIRRKCVETFGTKTIVGMMISVFIIAVGLGVLAQGGSTDPMMNLDAGNQCNKHPINEKKIAVIHPTGKHTHTLIWLHGYYGSGPDEK